MAWMISNGTRCALCICLSFGGMGVVALMIIVHEKNEIERIVLNVMSFKSSWQYVKSDQSDI